MSVSAGLKPMAHTLRNELEVLRGDWIKFLLLGVLLIVLGTMSLAAPWVLSLTTVLYLGVLVLAGGVAQAIGSFWSRRWSGFLLNLLAGVLYSVLGLVIIRQPGVSLATLTLLIAALLMSGGLFKVLGGLAYRFPQWGWVLLSGAVSLALGVMIWRGWPESSLWVIGLFLGLEMIGSGWSWVMLALAARRIPHLAEAGIA